MSWRTAHRSGVFFWPVFVWVVVQLSALGLSIFRVPLSARYPAPEEELAPHIMLAVQTAFSAMLFPFLFRSVSTGMFVVAIAPIFSLIAAAVGGVMVDNGLEQSLLVAPLWLCGLVAWGVALRSERARVFASAVLTFLVVGFALLAYLQREFGSPTQTFEYGRHAGWGPLMGGLAVLERSSGSGTVWIFLGSFLCSGLFAWGVGQLQRRRGSQTGLDSASIPTTPHRPI